MPISAHKYFEIAIILVMSAAFPRKCAAPMVTVIHAVIHTVIHIAGDYHSRTFFLFKNLICEEIF